jgi:hypothetical protein
MVLSVGRSPVRAATHVVDGSGGGDYLTIQEAADICADGDTISIAAGDYHEQVTFGTMELTIVGAGSEATRVLWDGDGAAFRDDGLVDFCMHTIGDLSIIRTPENASALRYSGGGHVALHDLDVVGAIHGDERFAADIAGCSLTALRVFGGLRVSTAAASSVRTMTVQGEWDYGGHELESVGSEYGRIRLLEYGSASLEGGSVDTVDVGYASGVDAEDCVVGGIESQGMVSLTRCDVLQEIGVFCSGVGRGAGLMLSESLVHGDVAMQGASEDDVGCVRIVKSTLLGNLTLGLPSPYNEITCYPWMIRSSIVMGETQVELDPLLWAVPITHNDFAGGFTITAPSDSVFANFSKEPLFCDADNEDYTLEECSPCAGTAHDGGDIGRYGVGCPCWTTVEKTSWGTVKALFRTPTR